MFRLRMVAALIVTASCLGPRAESGTRRRISSASHGRLRVRITSARGPVASRIRIAREDALPPPLGPDDRVVLAPEGRANVSLPPGAHRIVATAGTEWTMAETTVSIRPGKTHDARLRLEHVVDPGDWVACDFHVHGAASRDSRLATRDRLASLRAEGVRFAVATDHNRVSRWEETPDLETLPGVEVTTWDPEVGHFNAFPIEKAPRHRRRIASELFEELHAGGAIVQVNHPRLQRHIGYFDLFNLALLERSDRPELLDFDALEVWNGFDLGRPSNVDALFFEWLGLVERGHDVVATGNSDSHDAARHPPGWPRTYVRVPGGVAEQTEVVASLAEGRAFVTNGPFLEASIGGRGPGEVAPVASGLVPVHVTVRAPNWMDLDTVDVYAGTRHAASVDVPDSTEVLRFDRTVLVVRGRAKSIVVAVRGEHEIGEAVGRSGVRPMAFTNPIELAPEE